MSVYLRIIIIAVCICFFILKILKMFKYGKMIKNVSRNKDVFPRKSKGNNKSEKAFCDFCSTRVNLDESGHCLRCGAKIKNYNDTSAIENDIFIENVIEPQKGGTTKKIIKTIIIIIVAALLLMFAIEFSKLLFMNLGDIDLYSEYPPDYYILDSEFERIPLDYDGNVTIELLETYKDPYSDDFKIAVKVTNNTKKKAVVYFSIDKINEFSFNDFYSEEIPKNCIMYDVIDIYFYEGYSVSNINSIEISDLSYTIGNAYTENIDRAYLIKTNSNVGVSKFDFELGKKVFEDSNLGIEIYYSKDLEKVIFYNRSDNDYYYTFLAGTLNNVKYTDLYTYGKLVKDSTAIENTLYVLGEYDEYDVSDIELYLSIMDVDTFGNETYIEIKSN